VVSVNITVRHTLRDFENDQRTVARQAHTDMRQCVADGVRAGNELAKDYAREKNGRKSHSRKYPASFTARMGRAFHGFGVSIYSGEYGPLPMGQGMLAPILENGSRSGNAPQMNLARSADRIGPSFAAEVSRLPDEWFWPES
jgi:hypothetical protein